MKKNETTNYYRVDFWFIGEVFNQTKTVYVLRWYPKFGLHFAVKESFCQRSCGDAESYWFQPWVSSTNNLTEVKMLSTHLTWSKVIGFWLGLPKISIQIFLFNRRCFLPSRQQSNMAEATMAVSNQFHAVCGAQK